MTTFQGLGAGYHRDLQQDKQIIFASVDGTIDCLRMIAIALSHFEPKPEACMKALRDGDSVATDLCEGLVALGTPFRDAYGKVGKLVADQRAKGQRLADLTQAELEAAGFPGSLFDRLDPAVAAERRSKS
jgi:argininosuccinate lyase